MVAQSIDGVELLVNFVLLRQILLGRITRPKMERVAGQK